MSGKARIMEFLRANIGRRVTSADLIQVSGIQSAPRRTRELRAVGWPIDTRRDDPTLAQDEYMLTGDPPPGDVRIAPSLSNRLRAEVLSRNNHQCQMCGHGAGDNYPDTGQRVTLQVDHIVQRQEDGPDSRENLRTLCARCNEGGRDALPPAAPSLARLKSYVRGARRDDQQALYEWLRNRI